MSEGWDRLTALSDRSRRALYEYVRRQDHPVAREEAADATGMTRGLVAFHLDKLVDTGLLHARYEAPPGPRGRGRAPKVYEPTGQGLSVTIPQRRYELLAEILADAVVDDPAHADEAARRHARRHGSAYGRERAAEGADLVGALTALGFEPARADGRLVLRNCPFRSLADRHTRLVCGLNHAFVAGMVDGLAAREVTTAFVPRPDACCVQLSTAPPPAGPPG